MKSSLTEEAFQRLGKQPRWRCSDITSVISMQFVHKTQHLNRKGAELESWGSQAFPGKLSGLLSCIMGNVVVSVVWHTWTKAESKCLNLWMKASLTSVRVHRIQYAKSANVRDSKAIKVDRPKDYNKKMHFDLMDLIYNLRFHMFLYHDVIKYCYWLTWFK